MSRLDGIHRISVAASVRDMLTSMMKLSAQCAICALIWSPAIGLADPYWTGSGNEPVVLFAQSKSSRRPPAPNDPSGAMTSLGTAVFLAGEGKVTSRMSTNKVAELAGQMFPCIGVRNPVSGCRTVLHVTDRTQLRQTLKTIQSESVLVIEVSHVPMATGGYIAADAEYLDLKPRKKKRYFAQAKYSIEIPLATQRSMTDAKHARYAAARSSDERRGMFVEYEDYWFTGSPNRWEAEIESAVPELVQATEAALALAEAGHTRSASALWEARRPCGTVVTVEYGCGGVGVARWESTIKASDTRFWTGKMVPEMSWARVESHVKN